MAEVLVVVTKGDEVSEELADGPEIEPIIDADLTAFDEYFQKGLGNGPLVESERAILKTYLYWKCVAEKAGGSSTVENV